MKRLLSYMQAIRWFEIAVRMGAPVIALLMTIPVWHLTNVFTMLHVLTAFFFLWAHGYSFNEWSGYSFDKADRTKADTPLVSGVISLREMLALSLVCLSISIILYALLDARLLIIAGADSIIGVLYVHPRILLKQVPVMSLIILLFVSIGDFLLGWLVFSSSITQLGIIVKPLFRKKNNQGQDPFNVS